jgi:HK97 family phage portal protein
MNLFARMWDSVRSLLGGYLGPWSSSDPAIVSAFGYGPSKSGMTVNEQTAMNISAVWACVQLIAGNLASLPLDHYRRKANGDRERATDSRLQRLLHDEPNAEMTSTSFREAIQTHLLLWGNGFAEIRRDGAGRIFDLTPIEPWRVMARRRQGLYGPLFYQVSNRDGTMSLLEPESILHIAGLSANGIWGHSVVSRARESFGLTMAQEQFGATFFGKGATFGGVFAPKSPIRKEQREEFLQSIKERHEGVDRAHQFIVLPADMTFTQLGIPGRDAQFLQQRQFQIAEIARWFNVPPHMIGDVERSTSWGTGIEQQTIGFLQFTLRRWLVKWEQELNRKLISPLERNYQFIEFNVDGLERGDQDSRYKSYQIAIMTGWMTRNEVRRKENMPALDGLDEPLAPTNLTTAEKIAAPDPEPQPTPAPAAANEDDAADAADRAIQEALENVGRGVDQILSRPVPAGVDVAPIVDELAAVRTDVADLRERPQDWTRLEQFEAELRERLDSDAAARRALADRHGKLTVRMRALLEDGARYVVRRECDRAIRAAVEPEKLGVWVEEFYAGHADFAASKLRAALGCYAELAGLSPDDAEARARELVAGWITESRASLAALVVTPPEDLRAAVEALTTRWESERPAALADALTVEVAHG